LTARPDDSTAILLIAHGSRHEPANDDLRAMAARMSSQGRHAIVEACFLELAEPDIPTGGDRCMARGAKRVLMIPYFLSAGVHLIRDLTAARDELASRRPDVEFVLGAPLGPHPLLDDLVEVRIDEIGRNVGAVTASAPEIAERYRPLDDGIE
jgi:sirohydrochlorin ferrochelatase